MSSSSWLPEPEARSSLRSMGSVRRKAFRPEELDDSTRRRLRDIWEQKGSNAPGFFTPTPKRGPAGLLLLGAILAAAAVLVLWLAGRMFVTGNLITPLLVETILLAVGAAFAAGALYRHARIRRGDWSGAFVYLDGAHLWEVGLEQVKIIGTHMIGGAVWKPSGDVVVTTGAGVVRLHPHGDAGVELAALLQAWSAILDAVLNSLRANPGPAVLWRLAKRHVDDHPDILMADADKRHAWADALLERAQEFSGSDDSLPAPQTIQHRRNWTPFVYAAGLSLGGSAAWLLFPALNDASRESYLYGQVLSTTKDSKAADIYLRERPQGAHASSVREIRDDQRFERAKDKAGKGMREYLRDGENTRHRDEARKVLNSEYDAAIGTVERLAKDAKKTPELFQGFLAVLRSLKDSSAGVVTLAIVGQHTPEPTDPVSRLMEKLAEEDFDRRAKTIGFGSMEQVNFSRGIQAAGGVFAEDQIQRREKLIGSRLEEAMTKVFEPHLLRLEESRRSPTIEVHYHVRPVGTYEYKVSYPALPGRKFPALNPFDAPRPASDFYSLLRRYEVDWTITIRTPEMERPSVIRITSKPREKLTIEQSPLSEPMDPNWAPYAVILFSAFEDFSNQLVVSFGLPPAPARDRYSFKEAMGQEKR